MTMRDLLNVLFKRRLVLLCFFAATVVGGYAGLRLISPTYEATARLLVRIGQEDIYMPALPSSQFRTPVVSVVREEQLRSESNILTDAALARLVVREVTPQRLFPGIDVKHPWYTPKGVLQMLTRLYNGLEDHFFPLSANRTLEDKATDAFERALKAEAVKSSNTIEVSMRNKSPEAAALGVNTLVRLYLTERVRIYQREQSGFFADQLSQLTQQIASTEKQLAQFRSRSQIMDLDKQRSAQIDGLNDVRKRLDDTKVQLAQAQRRQQVLSAQLGSVPATTQLAGAESSNGMAISELSKQMADLVRRETDIAQRFSETDPRLAPIREERAALQRMLDAQQKQRYVSSEQGINPLHARIRDDLMQAEATVAALRQSSGNLTALEAEIQGRLGGFNTEDSAYKQLVQQLQVLRESRQLYLEKSEEARLSAAQAAARIGNVSVVSEAVPESKPVSPKLWLVLLGVLVGGLLGGIGLAFLLEFMDDSLESEADIQQYLQLPLLAKVPELAAA